jgi:copper chaperone CopZ
MKVVTFETPTLYGDHHVQEVRRILQQIPGVIEIYASSAFHVVEVSYDPAQTNDLVIAEKLDNAGYLGEWTVPMEMGTQSFQKDSGDSFFRHTEVNEAVRQVVGFGQNVNSVVSYSGRPLWNCPGMGPVRTQKMED